jgi:hypothetical protein
MMPAVSRPDLDGERGADEARNGTPGGAPFHRLRGSIEPQRYASIGSDPRGDRVCGAGDCPDPLTHQPEALALTGPNHHVPS